MCQNSRVGTYWI